MFRAKSDAQRHVVLSVAGREIPVAVRRYAHARGYRLRYDSVKGVALLSIPARGGIAPALDWARTQSDWLARQFAVTHEQVVVRPGVVIPVEGEDRTVIWSPSRRRTPELDGATLWVGGPQEPSTGPRVMRWLRGRALETLQRETKELAAGAQLDVLSIGIGDPRSRWGSCSSSGAIRYSWRLILAPPWVRRATVTHELAHLVHMDHSPAFHAAHARLLGEDPRPARDWLRTHGRGLHRFTV